MFAKLLSTFCVGFCVIGLGCGKSDSEAAKPIVAAQEAPQITEKAVEEVAKEPAEKAAPLPVGGSYQFPDDEGGKLLAKILPPKAPLAFAPSSVQAPIVRSLPPALSNPEVPFLPNLATPTLYPLNPLTPTRPVPLPDRIPLDLSRSFPDVPAQVVMPEGALSKLPSIDMARPVDLPILARPTPDRASLEDPTSDYTATSVIAVTLPLRDTTAAFTRFNLPDPFENVEAARLRAPFPEDPLSALGNPPPPKPEVK